MGAIIWLASYPKSGNTWMRVFLHNLLRNPKEPAGINSINQFCLGEDEAALYNSLDPRPLSTLTAAEVMALRPRVHEHLTKASPDSVFVKTHNLLGEAEGSPLVNMACTAGAIYVVRNPLDVAISYAHHFGLGLDEAIGQLNYAGAGTPTTDLVARQYYGTWSMHVASWTEVALPARHVVRFEDMIDDPLETFAGVARFLGLEPPLDRLQRAISHSSFEQLQSQENETGFVERSQYSRFFRSGQVGQWRAELTEDQINRIVSDHRAQMERFGYVPEGF
ncbi:MAG TPA: sulfotransferase domain-containing protein [Kiloniellales bacterium]